jgi:hypothetical protein
MKSLEDYALEDKRLARIKQRKQALIRKYYPCEASFLGKTVLVGCEGDVEVLGRLIFYRESIKIKHIPRVVIVQNLDKQLVIIREPLNIKTLAKKGEFCEPKPSEIKKLG